MRLKATRLVFCALASLAIISMVVLPVVSATPRFLKQLKLMYSTDEMVWTHVPGNQVSDFKLKLDPAVEWYYLDVMSLKSIEPIADGYYGFTVEDPATAEWYAFWSSKGALDGGADWQQLLYDISRGQSPIFYLRVDNGEYMLLDGFLYDLTGAEAHLRVDGDYLLGTYTYTGVIMGNTIEMQMMFR